MSKGLFLMMITIGSWLVVGVALMVISKLVMFLKALLLQQKSHSIRCSYNYSTTNYNIQAGGGYGRYGNTAN